MAPRFLRRDSDSGDVIDDARAPSATLGDSSLARPLTVHRALLVGLVFSLVLAPTAIGQTVEKKQKPECVTDRVEGVLGDDGYVVMTGWATDPSEGRVAKMEVAASRGLVSEVARWGEWRPDVMAHFKRPDYLWSGWTATVSLEDAPPGAVAVEVFAVARSGARISCGRREVVVRDVPEPGDRPAGRIGMEILWRSATFVAWLALLGWGFARYFCLRPVPLAAPLVGLSLFGVAAETGGALHVRPIYSAAALTVLAALGLFFVPRGRRSRAHPSRGFSAAALGAALLFAVVGVIPLASHGEGSVLGDIDDAVRECTVADSIAMYGWKVPPEVRGYLRDMPTGWENARIRKGGVYLLATLAQVFGTRSHAVHSVAMLGSGILVVLGTGLLAFRVLRSDPKLRWLPPLLTALNSTVIATLYGQHLGTLIAAGLFLLFLASIFPLLGSRQPAGFVPVALCLAAGLSFYPEAMPTWGVAAALSLMAVKGLRRRKRAAIRFALALALAIAVNPVAVARAARLWKAISVEPTLSSPYERMVVGDTHYFPSLNVITGLVPYRVDAPAPMGFARALLVPLAAALIVAVSVLGWRILSTRKRWLVLAMLVPVGLGLWANLRLTFPYGFQKFLLLAVPVWAVAFALFASRATAAGHGRRRATVRALSSVTIALVLLLELPSARHVVRHASRAVPSYDSAFRSLPAVARTVESVGVFRVEEYPLAGNHWILYFLGEHTVDFDPAAGRYPDRPRYRIVDRRRTSLPPSDVIASSRDFWLAPAGASR